MIKSRKQKNKKKQTKLATSFLYAFVMYRKNKKQTINAIIIELQYVKTTKLTIQVQSKKTQNKPKTFTSK